MNKETLNTASIEAQRFLRAVEALKKAQSTNQYSNPKESGAVRRASMDLTRALADMRTPG